MANPEHLEILQQGVEAWNQWREQHRDLWPDLSGADFNGANFSGANLCYTTFSEVDLSKTNLSEVLLYNTIFADTDFTDARGLETCDHHGPSTLEGIFVDVLNRDQRYGIFHSWDLLAQAFACCTPVASLSPTARPDSTSTVSRLRTPVRTSRVVI
jgi:Pentapeptide repeats (8 copies)